MVKLRNKKTGKVITITKKKPKSKYSKKSLA